MIETIEGLNAVYSNQNALNGMKSNKRACLLTMNEEISVHACQPARFIQFNGTKFNTELHNRVGIKLVALHHSLHGKSFDTMVIAYL